MILGYTLIEPDLKCDMLADLQLDACARYSNIYDLNIIDPNFKVKGKKYNISGTYDGFTIVSELFKKFCETEKYKGLEFLSLPNLPNFYWFKVFNVVEFDINARGTEFLNYNKICKGYEEIIGATPLCLKNKIPLSDGFYRTDICFGSFEGKSPVYLVGDVTMKKLKIAGFKEIFFEEILDKYDWQKIK